MIDPIEKHCPYCGERIVTTVDRSGGSAQYIEDCSVCCRPIRFHLRVSFSGELAALDLYREDE
jgi:hypothetical protein